MQLRPRDAAWDECRRKLRVLAQSDGGEGFFSEQLVWPKFYVEPQSLQANETQVEKTTSDMRFMFLMTFSIYYGELMFLSPDLSLTVNPGWLRSVLGWCLGGKLEEKGRFSL